MGKFIGIIESITKVYTTPVYTPGTIYQDLDTGKEYTFYQYASGASASTVAKQAVTFSGTTNCFTVIDTVAPNKWAGFATCVVAAGEYAWFQTKGPMASALKENTRPLSANCQIFGSAFSLGHVNGISNGVASPYPVIGYTTEATTSGSTAVDIFITG
jgi:hypothetical protein